MSDYKVYNFSSDKLLGTVTALDVVQAYKKAKIKFGPVLYLRPVRGGVRGDLCKEEGWVD